jgi:hypothetical protein
MASGTDDALKSVGNVLAGNKILSIEVNIVNFVSGLTDF